MNGSQSVAPVNFNAKKFAPERASQITARKISFGNMRNNTIDLYHKSRYALVMSKKQQSRPRKRDNETVRGEVPSEAREAFLDKCAASQYNRQIDRVPMDFMCEPESNPAVETQGSQGWNSSCSLSLWWENR
jgi:hypothetical protein